MNQEGFPPCLVGHERSQPHASSQACSVSSLLVVPSWPQVFSAQARVCRHSVPDPGALPAAPRLTASSSLELSSANSSHFALPNLLTLPPTHKGGRGLRGFLRPRDHPVLPPDQCLRNRFSHFVQFSSYLRWESKSGPRYSTIAKGGSLGFCLTTSVSVLPSFLKDNCVG